MVAVSTTSPLASTRLTTTPGNGSSPASSLFVSTVTVPLIVPGSSSTKSLPVSASPAVTVTGIELSVVEAFVASSPGFVLSPSVTSVCVAGCSSTTT